MNPQIDNDAALTAAVSALAQTQAQYFLAVGRIAALEAQLANPTEATTAAPPAAPAPTPAEKR